MQVTKSSTLDSAIEVKIVETGEYIEVRNCKDHPLNMAIMAELLKANLSMIGFKSGNYRVFGCTPEDLKLLRTEIVKAYAK